MKVLRVAGRNLRLIESGIDFTIVQFGTILVHCSLGPITFEQSGMVVLNFSLGDGFGFFIFNNKVRNSKKIKSGREIILLITEFNIDRVSNMVKGKAIPLYDVTQKKYLVDHNEIIDLLISES